jgi:hypothetical protein
MNHKALAIAPIVAVAALLLTAVGFAIPQQAFAGYGHNHNHNNHNNHNGNSIKASQQVNQQNSCTSAQDQQGMNQGNNGNGPDSMNGGGTPMESSSSSTFCLNSGDNQADISK